MQIAAALSMVGAVGVLALTNRSPTTVVLATVLAFGTGWVWPVLTNFGIVSENRDAAAAATGITQTGVYVGVFVGPLATGLLSDSFGFGIMWVVTALVMVTGAFITNQSKIGSTLSASSKPI